MGCCILGAMIIGRCIVAYERVRWTVAVLFGMSPPPRSGQGRRRVAPEPRWYSRRSIRIAIVAAELGMAAVAIAYEGPRGVVHIDDALSFLPWSADATHAVEPPTVTYRRSEPAPDTAALDRVEDRQLY